MKKSIILTYIFLSASLCIAGAYMKLEHLPYGSEVSYLGVILLALFAIRVIVYFSRKEKQP